MKKLSPEQDGFAKSIGATHSFDGTYWKGGGLDEAEQCRHFRWDDPEGAWRKYEIDFRDAEEMRYGDFQFTVERLIEYCHNSGVMCGELDTVEQMLKEM